MKIKRLIVIGILATAAGALAQDTTDTNPSTPPPAPGVGDPIAVPMDDDAYRATGFVDRDGNGIDDRAEANRENREAADRDDDRPRKYEPPSKLGFGMVIGGGVTDFMTDRASDAVQTGPEWAARINIGTRSFFGAEAAYVGSTNQVAGFTGTQGQLMSHGVQGLARVNFTRAAVQPYLGAGLGYRHYRLVNATAGVGATSNIRQSADVAEVPAATGIAFRGGGLILDARFNVGIPLSTPAFQNMPSSVYATTWGVNGNVGFEF
jgi:hypothetical protein